MFKVYSLNFGNLYGKTDSIKDAVALGKSKGFEYVVTYMDQLVGSGQGVCLTWRDLHA